MGTDPQLLAAFPVSVRLSGPQLWLAVAILGGLAKQDDKDDSFFDGDGMH